ncbi:hypothetical protein HYH03_003267 [Edaphochlamys debaryana]|uniref:Peptidase C14 caspase domain-containing protein n=1 Tax=Edaphochlamys debaryana TaxID=47281 RepID=A0A835YJZ9_9CHLO|nr:hypothetical protein HYH03_003267 [Edaphochlamys debaryana]|eukprot:KAG2499084.1 hypothetical protein HYH03_003267 [Edaphochlamys debaryana]
MYGYAAPGPAYGAPPGPYAGAPGGGYPAPYGAPAAPYPAPGAPYGAPPGTQYPAAPPAASYQAWGYGPPAPQPGPAGQPQAPAPSSAPPPITAPPPAHAAPSAGGYPSLSAPPPPTTVPAGFSAEATLASNSAQAPPRPTSAYPTMGGSTNSAWGSNPAPAQAPAQAPSPYGAAPYGAQPYGAAPPQAPAPQRPTAAYTYGQPPAGAPPAYAQAPQQAPQQPPQQAAYMAPTTYVPQAGHGQRRRRALLIGCSYKGTNAQLNGCLNDVQCIKYCLEKRFGFTAENFVVLRDDSSHPDFTSTKANIYRGIQWLMTDQRPGDSLFFHFSGHGSQQVDRGGDEEDGYDETICPTDFRHTGMIVDDELNRMMVRPLQQGVTLHAVIDACHSGTALDLPYRAKFDGAGRWYWKGRPRYDKQTMGGTAFQFGACKDSQVAADTNALSGKAYTGAATFSFIEAIEKYGTNQTYGSLLSHMMSTLRATTGPTMGSTTSFFASLLLGPGAVSMGGQEPVLSCDKQVDLYQARLSL